MGANMTEPTETTKKIETPVKQEGQIWNFTQDGVVVRADSLEEAQKIFNKIVKENKESDND